MAKDQYKNWLDENTDTNHFVDHFGPIYHTKPEQFTFTCGDIKMIQQISEYVQSTIRKKGYGYFKAENSRCPKNAKRHGTNNRDASEEELQQELFNGVSNLLHPYGEHVVSLFKKEMVIVANEDGVISGRVRCVICDTEFDTEGKKKKRRQELYSQFWNGNRWCLSNFANHHLHKVHPIQNDENQGPKENNFDEGKYGMNANQSILPVDELKNNLDDENSIEMRML